MKQIALIGGSGRTGRQFLEQALEKGYPIKALVRQPENFNFQHPHLTVIQGDVLVAEDVARTVAGADVVVSLFGHVKDSPEWLQTDGTRNIVEAMQKEGVNRILSLSGGGLPYPEKDEPKWIDRIIRGIMKIAVPKVLNDAIRHHQVLAESDLKWVIVRGPRLTDGPRKGTYRVGWVGVNSGTSISRADLAEFILQQVEDEQFNYQMPFVSY
jgi:putative NADH-flavin reductase